MIYLACKRGLDEIVEDLLIKGANPNIEDKDGNTPLHVAAYGGFLECIESLLKKSTVPIDGLV